MFDIVNPPEHIPLSDYHRAQARYVESLSGVPGIVSINNFGNVGAPGLSDLDFLVVVEDEFDSKHSIRLSCRRGLSILDGKLSLRNLRINPTRYDPRILLHGPVVVSRSQLAKLNYIIYAPQIESLAGETISQEMYHPEPEVWPMIRLLYLIDFMVARVSQFELSNELGVLDKRGWLTRIWSLTHSERMCEQNGISLSNAANETLKEIREIRRQWNDGTPCEDSRFVEVYRASNKVAQEILLRALERESEWFRDAGSADPLVFTAGDKRVECREEIQQPSVQFSKGWPKVLGRNRWYSHSKMPLTYGYHLLAYHFQDRAASQAVAAMGLSSPYLKTLDLRAKIVRQHRRFLFDNCLTFAMGGYLGLAVPPFSLPLKALDYGHWARVS